MTAPPSSSLGTDNGTWSAAQPEDMLLSGNDSDKSLNMTLTRVDVDVEFERLKRFAHFVVGNSRSLPSDGLM